MSENNHYNSNDDIGEEEHHHHPLSKPLPTGQLLRTPAPPATTVGLLPGAGAHRDNDDDDVHREAAESAEKKRALAAQDAFPPTRGPTAPAYSLFRSQNRRRRAAEENPGAALPEMVRGFSSSFVRRLRTRGCLFFCIHGGVESLSSLARFRSIILFPCLAGRDNRR